MSNSETFASIHLTGGHDSNCIFPDILAKGGARIKKNLRVGGITTTDTLEVRSNGSVSGDLHVVGLITSDTARELVPNTAAENRRLSAYQRRVSAAYKQYSFGTVDHPTNEDEEDFPNYIGNFHKGLQHDAYGEVDPDAYAALLHAIGTGNPDDFAAVPMGNAHAKLTNPQSGLAFDLEGADSHALVEPAPPKVNSARRAAEAVEDYWMALLRDVNFRDYSTNSDVATACTELAGLSDYNGPRGTENEVTPDLIFRSTIPGSIGGPYISQFLYLDCPFGATSIDQKIKTIDPVATALASGLPDANYGTVFSEWLNIENGHAPLYSYVLDPTRRYLRNGRDLSRWVHMDALFQAYLQALLILLTFCPLNSGNPYNTSANQAGFGTFGGPHIIALMSEGSTRALKAQWYQKWFVHRCLRPEAFGGLVHNKKTGAKPGYDIHSDVLNSTAVARVHTAYGTYLLPQAFPEYSPYHPSFGSGHATVAGCCVTLLKAFFNGSTLMPTVGGHPQQANADGTALENAPIPSTPLTVEGELNKIAHNVATGRCFAGIHWTSDSDESLRLGEKVAIEILRDQKKTYNENFAGFTFNKFSGESITI